MQSLDPRKIREQLAENRTPATQIHGDIVTHVAVSCRHEFQPVTVADREDGVERCVHCGVSDSGD